MASSLVQGLGARGIGVDEVRPAANASFVVAGGAQKLTAKHGAVTCAGLLKYEAETFYFSGHGLHKYASIKVTDGDLSPNPRAGSLAGPFRPPPRVPSSPWWEGALKTFIVAGCSVIDVGDKHDNFPSDRSDPGKFWATTGAAVYLGYAGSAPQDTAYLPERKTPRRHASEIIREVCRRGVTIENWLAVNREMNSGDACAIDARSGTYHWIGAVGPRYGRIELWLRSEGLSAAP